MPERACQCGRTFEVARASNQRKYCSDTCRVRFTIVPVRQFTCTLCGVEFTFKGKTRALYCPSCRRRAHQRRVERYKVKHGITEKLGVGSGGNQYGDKNPNARKRAGKLSTVYRKVCYHYWPRVCVLCGAKKNLEVNHIDANPANNDPHNLVPLCRSCHRAIHKLARRAGCSNAALLFFLWPNGRSKIAEKIGNPEIYCFPRVESGFTVSGIRGEGVG
jgi:hypothetical protein